MERADHQENRRGRPYRRTCPVLALIGLTTAAASVSVCAVERLTSERLANERLTNERLTKEQLASERRMEEVVVTARQVAETVFETPYSVSILTDRRIRDANFRTTPDLFREVPGALVQKTAHGQGSPYIRGFTGFRNLFMVDGVRLNNAIFREGPNQYWATVDPLSMRRMEVVRGPRSVLYGSDAIGGTVNVLTRAPTAFETAGAGDIQGGLYYRYGSGENSNVAGGHTDLALGKHAGLLIGGSYKDFGNIDSGGGDLPNTGYDEWTLDGKLVYDIDEDLRLVAAHSRVRQDDVPRTHRTVFSRSFQGTTVGSELQRTLDQDRLLSYVRIEADQALRWRDLRFTLFNHRQEESRRRLRSDDRRDHQSVKVDTLGFNLHASLETKSTGVFTAGMDWAHDSVDSDSSQNPVQGPVADDASYDWAGIFLQNRLLFGPGFDLTSGLRLGHFRLDADRVSDPGDGREISLSDDWTKLVGNLRLGWTSQKNDLRFYGGASQGFRAPNLSDTTRFDSARSNEFEIPAPGLDPEEFLQYELGLRYRNAAVELEAATYYIDIDDQIQRLLTGRLSESGEMEVTKANVGDGDMYGVEVTASWLLSNQWYAFGQFSWLDGEITNEAEAGAPSFDDNHSRMMPTNYRIGLRFQPARWWIETELIRVEKADALSLRDRSDTQRIPPGGTPGYTLWHIRGGFEPVAGVMLNVALENITDENYRVHGSGQNEVGRNLVLALDYAF